MFNALLGQEIEWHLRHTQEQHARLHPEQTKEPRVHWLRRLIQRFWKGKPPAPSQPEITVPDDRIGLYIENGIPRRFMQPGRHPLPDVKAKVELRLIPVNLIRQLTFGDVFHIFQELPYDRAYLLAGGELIATEAPALMTAQLSLPPRPIKGSAPRLAGQKSLGELPRSDDDEDLLQGFSFV
jgi:hypothetical protein